MRSAKAFLVAAVAFLFVVIGSLAFAVVTFVGGVTVEDSVVVQGDAACVINADLGSPVAAGTYDEVQMRNAQVIVVTGAQLGISPKGQQIAIATALQESGLRNLASRAVPASLAYPNDGVAPGDHLSVGIMQQQPWWWPDGMADGMSVAYQARQFYGGADRVPSIPGLLDINGWEQMEVWQAAQAVQRSAFPTAYQKWADDAAMIVAAINVNAPITTGVSAVDCDPALNPDGAGLRTLPGNTVGERVVNAAAEHMGVPYSWGGGSLTGPSTGICNGRDCYALNTVGFDCSGLTRYAWYQGSGGSITIPRVAADQYRASVKIPRNQIQAGDMIFLNNLGHVGLYDGNGGMVHAPRKGKTVEYVPNVFEGYWSTRVYGIGRPALPST